MKNTRGQSLVEYALIVVLVAVVVIGAAFAVGLGIQRIYGLVPEALERDPGRGTGH